MSVVNTLLKFFLKFLSPLERPDSFIALQRTIAEKVFIAQFVNTALVMLIINAAIPEIANIFANFVFAGDYRDFDTLWYEDIGGPLLLTMMVNAVVPHAELENVALEWAAEINTKSPTAQRMAKFAMNLVDDGLVGQQVFAGEATRLAYMTDEAEEGRDAFLEKRDRDFSKFPWHF